MKRYCCLILVALAMVMAVTPGYAALRYNDRPSGSVADYADILSPEMVNELGEFHDVLMEKSGVDLTVATVHFFDGKEPADFTQELFAAWELSDMGFLMVLAAGEDSFYTMAGSKLAASIPEASQQHLLSASFQGAFMRQEYDQALAQFMPALANLITKQLGARIDLTGMFGQTSPVPTAAPKATASPFPEDLWESWESGIERVAKGIEKVADKVTTNVISREEKSSGISLGKIFLVLLIFYFIFGGKRRSKGRNGCGCLGCGPIAGILAARGIREVFKNE